MTMRKGLPAKKALTDADDTRYDFRNLVVCNADGTPRTGLTTPIATTLVTGRADMQVNVGAFNAVVRRDSGAILLANDGTIQVTIPNAPVSGTRTHVVAARQDDSSGTVTTPDGDDIAKVYVIQDTGSGQPAVPDGSIGLATVAISAGQVTTNATTITQFADYTAAPGGTVPFRTQALLNAWTTPPRLGQLAEVLQDATTTNRGIYRWNGATWDQQDTGWINFAAAAGWTIVTQPQYRKLNNVVFVRGQVSKNSGAIVAAETVTAALPAGYRPSTLEPISAVHSNGTPMTAGVQPAGVISAYPAVASPSVQVIFHGSFVAEA